MRVTGGLATAGSLLACLAVAAGGSARPATAPRAAAAGCIVPGTHERLGQLWHPDLGPAIRYAHHRRGDIAFAVRMPGRFAGYRFDHREWSASVVKAMLLVAYLDRASVSHRPLRPGERAVLGPMIRVSDNNDAQRIFDIVGQSGLRRLALRVGMNRFSTSPVWGATEITARDQTLFFLNIERLIAARHRSYALRLLRSISPQDRWGVAEVAPLGWRLYFKGGWGYGTGLLDHQVALLTRGCARVSIAVLTMHDGSHAYGKATLKGIFARLLRGFPRFR
jgi:hypothetical protein